MSARMFPIMEDRGVGPGQVPWDLMLKCEPQALKNHSQTIQRLAERCGLSWSEAHAVLNGYVMRAPYIDPLFARREVEALVEAWGADDDRKHIAYLESQLRKSHRLIESDVTDGLFCFGCEEQATRRFRARSDHEAHMADMLRWPRPEAGS